MAPYGERREAVDADGLFGLKRDQRHPRCKLLDLPDLSDLCGRAGSQDGIARLSRCKAAVDNPSKRLDFGPAQVILKCTRLEDGCRFR